MGAGIFVTAETRAGSTIRIDAYGQNRMARYSICHTQLVASFREIFGDCLQYLKKNRAIILDIDVPLPDAALRHCIVRTLTCHLRDKTRP